MAVDGMLFFSVVEDVLQQHGTILRDLDLESRKTEESDSRRYEASGWLRKMVGVVTAKDLPTEASEEEFRLGLRSGIILCNALNKVQEKAVPKVVESPCDATLMPDGAALSAFQYFENVRNFLMAIQQMGIPTFEASDLEQGGKAAKVVNSVLALKSYYEWKQTCGGGTWKFGGNVKPIILGNSFSRKSTQPFTNSLSRNSSLYQRSLNVLPSDIDSNKMVGKSNSASLSTLVHAVLADKKPEDVPMLVESVLSKVVEEFQKRDAACHHEQRMAKDTTLMHGNKPQLKSLYVFGDNNKNENKLQMTEKEKHFHENNLIKEKPENCPLKQQTILDKQQTDIQELKKVLHTTKIGMQFMTTKLQEEFNILGMHVHGLSHAASGYNRVLEENRKLYNQVQDLKGSIRVYCRVRPISSGLSDYASTVDHIEEGTIGISAPLMHGKGRKSFTFNKVFGPSATQVEVFFDMQPLIRSVLDGYNVCIFAYGQTGSGKTYTMAGPKDLNEKNRGVNYRALGDLFLLAEQRKNVFHYDVAVQMIEIYNEQVRDLFVADGSNKRLEIRNSSHNGLNVPDANLIVVSSTSDVIDLMNLGQSNRSVGATALNDRSSRSHSCLTVHVQGRDLTSGTVLRGCLHLVDLAGSERVDKSEVTGDRLKEAQYINKSLSALGDVIASLAQKNSHVPYRNSKLTQLLQDSLGGQAKTLMFVHVSPELDSIGETISTLKFAERVSSVERGAARVNKDTTDVKELKEQIATLKAALARKEGVKDHIQPSISGSSVKSKHKNGISSPVIFRHPMGDVGNIEVHVNSKSRQKKQSIDLDELLADSPPWPPVTTSSGQIYEDEDEKDTGFGEWVDKVMVNKQDDDDLYQKYLTDLSSRLHRQESFMSMGINQFTSASNDGIDDLDAIASDSSETDLLWQFNQARLSSLTNGIELNAKSNSKSSKISELRNSSAMSGPSPSQKLANRSGGSGTPLLKGRQVAHSDGKRRTGMRK